MGELTPWDLLLPRNVFTNLPARHLDPFKYLGKHQVRESSSRASLGINPTSWAAFGHLLILSVPQFLHLYNGNKSIPPATSHGGKIIHDTCNMLEQFPGSSTGVSV